MAITSFDPDVVIDYVPKFMDNRDADDPLIIGLKYLSHSKVQSLKSDFVENIKDVNDMSVVKYQGDIQRHQLINSIDYVKGYLLNKQTGKKKVIKQEKETDIEVFVDTAPKLLIMELLLAIENVAELTDGQVKNS